MQGECPMGKRTNAVTKVDKIVSLHNFEGFLGRGDSDSFVSDELLKRIHELG